MKWHFGAAILLAGAALGFSGSAGFAAEVPSRAAIIGGHAHHPIPVLDLAPHRTTYKLTLLSAIGSKSPTAARGMVSYEFLGSACEGYSQNFRQMTELQPAEGSTKRSDMRSATFETGDGRSFSFDIRTLSDQNAPDIVDGRAELRANDLLAIRLLKPSQQRVEVDNDVLFPTAHIEHIIAAAEAGKHVLAAKVFDGSDDGKKVYDTTTVIGRRIVGPTSDLPREANRAIDSMPRWPVTISYFEEGHMDHAPAYVLGFELYENGVSRALRFDYGDFVLAGQMATLDMLPTAPCKR